MFNLIFDGKLRQVLVQSTLCSSDRTEVQKIRFKLDTGASITTVKPSDLLQLGYTRKFIETQPKIEFTVATDKKCIGYYVTIPWVRFGDAVCFNFVVLTVLEGTLHNLLGMNAIEMFDWTLLFSSGLFAADKISGKRLKVGETIQKLFSIEELIPETERASGAVPDAALERYIAEWYSMNSETL